jgi:Cu/Ag efflux protein CusF
LKRIYLAAALLLVSLACSTKQAEFVVAHKYTLTGTVVSLNSKAQTASIDAAAVPGFMEAMRMDYPVKSRADFDRLRAGEKISATLNVSASNDEYNLTDIHDQSAGSK